MDNYRDQKACGNCRHVFHFSDYDGDGDWYCDVRDDRPLCGSVALGESDINDAEYDEWLKWANGSAVKPYGICDLHMEQ